MNIKYKKPRPTVVTGPLDERILKMTDKIEADKIGYGWKVEAVALRSAARAKSLREKFVQLMSAVHVENQEAAIELSNIFEAVRHLWDTYPPNTICVKVCKSPKELADKDCPVCHGEGVVNLTEHDQDGYPYNVPMPCFCVQIKALPNQ